jgi:dUTP pyrophosphatase
MFIKFKRLNKDAILPQYAHPSDAGMDLYSLEDRILKPQERYAFKTGLAVEIPKNYVGLIWDKSGLALSEGLTTLGGVIDSGYRGEIGVVILNTSNKKINIEKSQKIAQFLIQPIVNAKVKEVDDINSTSRGQGGFGSTGRK